MTRTTALAALLLAVAVSPACSSTLQSRSNQSSFELEENVLRTTLDNGLKVVLVEDHSAPVVALNVWVRVGSADEHADEAGMAHVFEHMLFKGTERRGVGEIARTVEAAGGMINAFTSFDMTVYHITMASRDAATGIDVLADSVRFSTFDPNELASEMEVVVEEIRRGDDSPGRALSQGLFSLAYQDHPYNLPVIGTRESVRSFSREQMLEFHQRWYVPNNMSFVVVGDIDPDETLAQIKKAFEGAQPRRDLSHPRRAESTQSEPRVELLRKSFDQTLVGLAYPAPEFANEDTAYVDLLSWVLGGGESSRLYRQVKDKQQLVHGVSASAYTPLDPGLFFIDLVLEPANIEAALASVRSEIERLVESGPNAQELERARVNLLSHEVHEKETMQGQARKYGYFETLADGIEVEAEYNERIRKATIQDLRRVAEKYLRSERASLVVLIPEAKRPDLNEATLLGLLENTEASDSNDAKKELEGGILHYTLDNGLRVVVKPNQAIGLVSMRLAFLGGLLAETADTQGITAFASEMIEKGTEQRSAAQFAAEVESMAGSVAGFSGRNTLGMTAEFLSNHLDAGLDLFADVLLHPSFEPKEIDKLREETLAALRRREDNLQAKAFELFSEGLYPNHPYRFPTLGNETTVQSFDRDSLRQLWSRYAQPSNGVLAIVGDVDADAVVEGMASRLAGWTNSEKVSLPERTRLEPARKAREVSLEKGRNQVHLIVGYTGLTMDDPEAPALEVLTQVLAGQGGRLFLELRDKQSLAYVVTAFSNEGVDPGSFGVYIASDPSKLDQARAGLDAELRRILDEPVTPLEIERAKAYLIGSQAVSLQRFGSQASMLSLEELYGLGATHHLEYESRIEAVTADDLSRVAKRIIKLDAPLTAIVK